MPFDPSRLHDPSSYERSKTNMLSNYSYTVRVFYNHPRLGEQFQDMTIRSNEVMHEDAIRELAMSYARASGKSGIQGDISNVEITGAKYSKSLGEL